MQQDPEARSRRTHRAADMDAFKELERRFRCSDCGKKEISIEPIWHSDWTGR